MEDTLFKYLNAQISGAVGTRILGYPVLYTLECLDIRFNSHQTNARISTIIYWAIAFFIRCYPQVEDTRISDHFTKVSTLKLRLKTEYPSTLVKFRLDIRALII